LVPLGLDGKVHRLLDAAEVNVLFQEGRVRAYLLASSKGDPAVQGREGAATTSELLEGEMSPLAKDPE
jgi:hypothetical protein